MPHSAPVIVSGHQPTYLPWLGLLHKASLCDVYVFMDDARYLEGDWMNRNRIKVGHGRAAWLTVPVDLKGSASLRACDIRIAADGPAAGWQARHWEALRRAYAGAPHFKAHAPFFEWLYLDNAWTRLDELCLAQLRQFLDWLGIRPRIVRSSELGFTEAKSALVLAHGLRFGAAAVVTGVNGADYIDHADFAAHGVAVHHQRYRHPEYPQRFGGFLSHLSAADLFFNAGPEARALCLGGNIDRAELHRLLGLPPWSPAPDRGPY